MNKKKQLIKNGSLYLIGNIFNKAIGFITIPIFTRMMSTVEYGIVNTYNSWVLIVSCVVGLSLGYSIRNAYVDYKDNLGEYISSILMLSFLNFISIFAITNVVIYKVSISRAIVNLCLLESFSSFVVNAIIIRYIMEEDAAKRVALLVLPNLIGAILSVFLIRIIESEKYYGRILSTCLCSSVFAFSIIFYYWIKYRACFKILYWKYALSISLPLVLHAISINILNASDRTIITMYRGAAETGVYGLVYSVGWTINIVTSSAESMWIPKFTNALLEKDYKKINKHIYIYIYVCLFAFCGLLTISPELILLMGGKQYTGGIIYIVPIISSLYVLFIYSIFVAIEFFYKKTSMVAVSTLIAALLNVVLNFIFVPNFGAMAAAITTLFSYIVCLFLHRHTAHSLDSQIAPDKLFVLPSLIFGFSAAFTYVYRYNIVLRWGVMVCCGICLLFYLYRKIHKERMI